MEAEFTGDEVKVLYAIKLRHDTTDGHMGLPFVRLILDTGLTFNECRPILRKLYDAGQIHYRKGLNDTLLYYGKKKR